MFTRKTWSSPIKWSRAERLGGWKAKSAIASQFNLFFVPLPQPSAHFRKDFKFPARRIRSGARVRREEGRSSANSRTQNLFHYESSQAGKFQANDPMKAWTNLKLLKFVANEHTKGSINAELKEAVIEPDGPSVVSKDDDDSKVTFLS